MKTGMRLSEYINVLSEKRENEEKKIDYIHERGEQITSPTSATSKEETRILTEYIEQSNLFKVGGSSLERKKPLVLKRFFKMKRNQQVDVYVKTEGDVKTFQGKVNVIGRNFVMLTNLSERIWIPYQSIESANIPSGVPTYSNSHQNFIYDNQLRDKLLNNFGQTVSKRDALKQQFYEETLFTNLRTWEGTWVKVTTTTSKIVGKIMVVEKDQLQLAYFGDKQKIHLSDVEVINTLRFFSIIRLFFKKRI
ncbi:hypothetical protein [Litchfieldia alkalitelluris]|uniref:hypothetical protein n=1 Tax=Litchfieldia alkalitelluris TaxID=304268 RepID=UPI000998D70E|nr:hypothetical protein [Litchfieldia alkalitelluris]